MTKRRVVILGAGLSGLSVALHLQRMKVDCLVLEREAEAGGLCRSKNISGFTFDYDGHLLHFKKRSSLNFVKQLLGNNLIRHKRDAAVYFSQKYLQYPFQANLYGLPDTLKQECLTKFMSAQSRPFKYQNNNFLDWINSKFGKGIAKYFMVPYNMKFWTVPPKSLTCEWLDGFIPVPNHRQVLEGALKNNNRRFGYNSTFWYPKKGGMNQVISSLVNRVSNIQLGCPVTEIDFAKKEIKIDGAHRERFDLLIFTIPLPEVKNLVQRVPKNILSLIKKLRWNSVFNLNLGIKTQLASRYHWVYFSQEDVSFFRVGFPHNFSHSAAPYGQSALYSEVSYSKHRPIDKKSIINRIENDLLKVGILKDKKKICVRDINDIEYAYPIYDKNYRSSRENIIKFLNRNNIITCGRYGSWRYMSMEDVMFEAGEISKNVYQRYIG